MIYQKFKTILYCGRYYLFTVAIEGNITPNGRKLLIGKFVKRNRKKSVTVNDNTNKVKRLDIIHKTVGEASAEAGKKQACIIMKTSGRHYKEEQNLVVQQYPEILKQLSLIC